MTLLLKSFRDKYPDILIIIVSCCFTLNRMGSNNKSRFDFPMDIVRSFLCILKACLKFYSFMNFICFVEMEVC